MQRYDLSLATVEPVSIDAIHELANLPGVYRSASRGGRSRRGCGRGNHSRRVGIMGLPHDAALMRLKTETGKSIELPPDGLVISQKAGRRAAT